MSLPLTPLVTDIQWPPWLKMGPAPKKRNVQSTCGLPMHMGGVRQAARCPYGAAEPPWAMVRCYSSSHSPILYTSCVGLLQLLTHNYLGHSARIARNRSTRIRPSLPDMQRTRYPLSWSDFDVPGFFLHACARSDHSVSKIIIFKSAAGSISFRSTVSQSCSIHACVGGLRPRGGRASAVTMAMPAAGCCLPCATSGGHPTRHSGVP